MLVKVANHIHGFSKMIVIKRRAVVTVDTTKTERYGHRLEQFQPYSTINGRR